MQHRHPAHNACPAHTPRTAPRQLDEVCASREGMAALLGGYQRSIAELQDRHSVEVVRLQGEAAALQAEVRALPGGGGTAGVWCAVLCCAVLCCLH